MTDDLVTRWTDYVESMGCVMGEVERMADAMAARIKADAATIARLEGDLLASASLLATEHRIRQTAVDALEAAEAKVAALVEALESIAEGPKVGDLMEPWIVGVMTRARAAIAAANGGNIDSEDRKGGE